MSFSERLCSNWSTPMYSLYASAKPLRLKHRFDPFSSGFYLGDIIEGRNGGLAAGHALTSCS
jgi:hypothetical protein